VNVPPEVFPAYLIHWDAPDWCASAVGSLLASRGVDLRVTVIDNGQRTGSPVAELLPSAVRVIRTGRNVGYAGGANVALADWRNSFPGSPLCLIGSHDLHLSPNAVKELIRASRENRGYGILAPAISVPVGDSVFESSGGTWSHRGAIQLSLATTDGVQDRDWVSGACLVLHRDCVEELRGFDERFGSYVEDVDLCLRAKDAGWRVGVVTWAAASTLGSSSRYGVGLNEANVVLLAVKRHGFARGLVGSMKVLFRGLRSLAGSLAFWRDRHRRQASRYFLGQHVHAAKTLVHRRALIRSLGREGTE
jgi:GT2 family glycosyltransferase